MGPGAGLRMAWLRGGPCNRWWCGWGAGAAARRASGFDDAAAAIAAATAKGLGKSPAPKALVRSLEKVKEDYKKKRSHKEIQDKKEREERGK